MENITAPAGVIVDTPNMQTAAPVQQVQSGAIPNVQPNSPQMAMGGDVKVDKGGTFDFIKNVNWVEVLILTAGTVALFSVISYYRTKQIKELNDLGVLSKKVSSLENQIKDLEEDKNTDSGFSFTI